MHDTTTPLADDERLLVMQEVSERTRITVDGLRWLRAKKQGPPCFRLGKRVVYPERALNAWLGERQAADRGAA